jgi:hypothetical protein
MTVKDLQRIVLTSESDISESAAMTRLVNDCPKLFYKWNDKNHWSQHNKQNKKQCCFWDWIGVPLKDNVGMPVLPYQRLLYRMLQEHKHIWIKKSRGLGVTTFFLYWIAHQCLTQYKPGDRVCIVVGPGIDIAEDWIVRFKSLFRENFPAVYSELIKQQRTVAILNGVRVEAFPSHHVDTMRGLDKVKCIMSDETDYYPPFQQKEVRAVIEGYIGKPNSDPHIMLLSTPKNPNGLMQQIELEQDSIYYNMFLTYEYGLEGPRPIYTKERIERARKSPDFPREYEGKYVGVTGNVFSTHSLDRAVKLGERYDLDPNNPSINLWHKDAPTIMALDPAWGSTSKYGVIVSQFIDRRVVIVYAHEYSKPDIFDMVLELRRLSNQTGHITNILIDSNNPEAISSVRREFRKDQYSEQGIKDIIIDCRKYNTPIENRLFVVPKYFSIEGRKMLQHAVTLLDNPEGFLAIPKRHESLLVALRSATADEWKLTKKDSLHNDLTDAFIMALSYYRITS